jgi:hypothetical protein
MTDNESGLGPNRSPEASLTCVIMDKRSQRDNESAMFATSRRHLSQLSSDQFRALFVVGEVQKVLGS